jgi:hypothetical protein
MPGRILGAAGVYKELIPISISISASAAKITFCKELLKLTKYSQEL